MLLSLRIFLLQRLSPFATLSISHLALEIISIDSFRFMKIMHLMKNAENEDNLKSHYQMSNSKEKDKLWRKYLKIDDVEADHNVVFTKHIHTNGESISIQMHQRKDEIQKKQVVATTTDIDQGNEAATAAAGLALKQKQRKALEKCDREVVLNPGLRDMIASVIIGHKTGNYQHIKFSNKKYLACVQFF